MQNFKGLAQKLWICTPILFSAICGRSTWFAVKRKVKFEFRLQKWIPWGRLHRFRHLAWKDWTLYRKKAGGVSPPHGGVWPPFFSRNQNTITNQACMQNFRVLAQKLWICTPIHFSAICGRSTWFAVKRKVKFEFRLQKWIPWGRLHRFRHLAWKNWTLFRK